MKAFYQIFWLIMATCSAMTGFQIHHSIAWACVDFLFWPVALIKWLICHQINLSLIQATFSFFLT